MSDLYTVRMKRKMIRTTYDARGCVTGENTTFLDETYTDLPHLTAMSYLKNFPEAQVTIEPQTRRWGDKPRVSTSTGGSTRRTTLEGFAKAGTKPVAHTKTKRTLPERTPSPSPKGDAGYADVVNKMMGAR